MGAPLNSSVLSAAYGSGSSTVLAVTLPHAVETPLSRRVISVPTGPDALGNPRQRFTHVASARRTIHALNRQPRRQTARRQDFVEDVALQDLALQDLAQQDLALDLAQDLAFASCNPPGTGDRYRK